jgi:hypothetical protein
MATEPRAHHFISQCYLKGFTPDGLKDSQLFAVDVIELKNFPTKPANVGHRRDFNRMEGLPAGSLESALGRFEAEADVALRKIHDSLSLDDWDAWNMVLNLASLFAVRTPRMREQARSFVERLNKVMLDVITATPERWVTQMRRAKESGAVPADVDLSHEQVRAYLASDPLEVEMPVAAHVDREFRLQDEVLKLLGQRQWVLLVAEEGSGGFITSDQPLALVPSDGSPRPVGHGLAHTTVFFPVNHGARGILIKVILDEFGDQIVAVKASEKVPERRYPVGFSDIAPSASVLSWRKTPACMVFLEFWLEG